MLQKNGEILMTYNYGDTQEKGRFCKITHEGLVDLFKTTVALRLPVFDGDNSYFTNRGVILADTCDGLPVTLYKFNCDGELLWDYHLNGIVRNSPVIYKDMVFIYDTILSQEKGLLTCINKNTGGLIWKHYFTGPIWTEPFIDTENETIIIGTHLTNELHILDLKGNVRKTIPNIGTCSGFSSSRSKPDILYTSLFGIDLEKKMSSKIVACNAELEPIWDYRPISGSAFKTPALDSSNNLYVKLNDNRLLSLDAEGKERWLINIIGFAGFSPLILQNDQILMISTKNNSGKYANIEPATTYLELFSPQGERIAESKISGMLVHATNIEDKVIVATSGVFGVKNHRTQPIVRIAFFNLL